MTPGGSGEVCEVCGREYAVWFAPSHTWNSVMRDGVRANADRVSMICPTCFTLDAEQHGVRPTAWMVSEESGGPSLTPVVREMLQAAEMRWMSVEDATITVKARTLAELGRENAELRGRVEQAEEALAQALHDPDETRYMEAHKQGFNDGYEHGKLDGAAESQTRVEQAEKERGMLVTLVRFGFLVNVGGRRALLRDVGDMEHRELLTTILQAEDSASAASALAARAAVSAAPEEQE